MFAPRLPRSRPHPCVPRRGQDVDKPANTIKKAKPTAAESRITNAAKAETVKAAAEAAAKNKADATKSSREARASRVRA